MYNFLMKVWRTLDGIRKSHFSFSKFFKECIFVFILTFSLVSMNDLQIVSAKEVNENTEDSEISKKDFDYGSNFVYSYSGENDSNISAIMSEDDGLKEDMQEAIKDTDVTDSAEPIESTVTEETEGETVPTEESTAAETEIVPDDTDETVNSVETVNPVETVNSVIEDLDKAESEIEEKNKVHKDKYKPLEDESEFISGNNDSSNNSIISTNGDSVYSDSNSYNSDYSNSNSDYYSGTDGKVMHGSAYDGDITPESITNSNSMVAKDNTGKEYAKGTYVGNFYITQYSPADNDPKGTRCTCTGNVATEGVTVAASKNIFKMGDRIIVGDHVYIVEDIYAYKRLGDNRIDIFVKNGTPMSSWRDIPVYMAG